MSKSENTESFKPSSEEQGRWHTCLRKVAFDKIEHAYMARNQQRDHRRLSVYRCQYCALWHLSKTRSVSSNG